jgi:hypothetical protein
VVPESVPRERTLAAVMLAPELAAGHWRCPVMALIAGFLPAEIGGTLCVGHVRNGREGCDGTRFRCF